MSDGIEEAAVQHPDDAVMVGEFGVVCPYPDCDDPIQLPVWAWLVERDGDTFTMTMADNDPLWEHSLLRHPEVH